MRELVVEVLNDLGYRALEAVDGPSGLKILQSAARIDLLVTDIGLPGMNGRVRSPRRRASSGPILRFCSYRLRRERRDGATAFLRPAWRW